MKISSLFTPLVVAFSLPSSVHSIYNGEKVNAGEYPAYALLCTNTTSPSNCGPCAGVLITSQHVLTVGDCVEQFNNTGVLIGPSQSTSDGTYYAVINATVHPDWQSFLNPSYIVNDLAILTLDSAVADVTPMEFNRVDLYTDHEGDFLTLLGYGFYDESENLSDYLRKTVVESQTDVFCADAAENDFTNPVLFEEEKMFCTTPFGDGGACLGDSGNPVIDGSGLVWGIHSFGAGGCASNKSDFFTELSTYADWIDSQTGATAGPTQIPRPTTPEPTTRAPTVSPTPRPTEPVPPPRPDDGPLTPAPFASDEEGCCFTTAIRKFAMSIGQQFWFR